MSSLKDRDAGFGAEETRRKPPTTAITLPRRGVIVALRDAELGRKVCECAEVLSQATIDVRVQSIHEPVCGLPNEPGPRA